MASFKQMSRALSCQPASASPADLQDLSREQEAFVGFEEVKRRVVAVVQLPMLVSCNMETSNCRQTNSLDMSSLSFPAMPGISRRPKTARLTI